MNYVLIGSRTSPYVRKIRILLHTIAPYELKDINYLEKNDNAYLMSVNPINKIPVFLDGDIKIFDSRVIYNYLAKKHHLKPLSIAEENILSAIDAAMDASINLFSLRRGGLDLSAGNTYIERQQERIPHILNSLAPWSTIQDSNKPAHWNFLTISLYSYLYWTQFREVLDLNLFLDLKNFMERFAHAPGVAETTPL